jgi:hypothetical protein
MVDMSLVNSGVGRVIPSVARANMETARSALVLLEPALDEGFIYLVINYQMPLKQRISIMFTI